MSLSPTIIVILLMFIISIFCFAWEDLLSLISFVSLFVVMLRTLPCFWIPFTILAYELDTLASCAQYGGYVRFLFVFAHHCLLCFYLNLVHFSLAHKQQYKEEWKKSSMYICVLVFIGTG